MKYYIGSRLENIEQVRYVRDNLIGSFTYDWTIHNGPVYSQGEAVIRETMIKEVNGVKDANIVLMLLPGGRGAHAELGAALATNKPVLMYAFDIDVFKIGEGMCAFYYHPNVVLRTNILNHFIKEANSLLQEYRSY